MRLDFRFRRQTTPISRLPGSSPPDLLHCLSPAAHQPPTLLGDVIMKVAPTSSPCGSIFGFGAKPPPSRAYRAPAPWTFCIASHPQPTNPQRCWVVLLRRSHRHRARAARFSVSAPNHPHLALTGLQPSHCSKYMFFYYSQPHTVCLHPMYASCITMDPFVCSIYFLSYVYIYCII
jgi:hypothetical protein